MLCIKMFLGLLKLVHKDFVRNSLARHQHDYLTIQEALRVSRASNNLQLSVR